MNANEIELDRYMCESECELTSVSIGVRLMLTKERSLQMH